MHTRPCCNIELKARLESLDKARRLAADLATARLEDEHQVDTYFHCHRGRLKLREINGTHAQLVAYQRADHTDPTASRYFVVPASEPALLKQALTAALGVKTIVDKQRQIFLHDNVRIHLDVVQGLGKFLEFEAVLESDADAPLGEAVVRRLRTQFEIADDDLLSGSYSDMIGGSS